MKIQIHKPCPEDWNNMSIADGGKYCASCSKVVVDFTSMSEEEIKDYFLGHIGQKTCGQFNASQLHVSEKRSFLNVLREWREQLVNASGFKGFSRMAFSLLGIVVLAASCRTTTPPPPMLGEPAVEPDSTEHASHERLDTMNVIMGKPSIHK